MNVVSPSVTSHQLKVVPRFYPVGQCVLRLKNKVTGVATTQNIEPVISDGYLYADYTHTFKNLDSYQVEMTRGDEVVYRGKIFATDQFDDTQDYKITKDVFTL